MKFSKTGWIITLCVSAILFAPFLWGKFFLIEQSSDMAAHTAVISAIVDGKELPDILYYGQVIVGYPLAFIIKLTHLSVKMVYLIFNYSVLISVPIVLFLVVKTILGGRYSLFIAPVVLLCSTSILALFQYGVIYSVINMYLILPIAVLIAIKWVISKRVKWLLLSVALFSLFSAFHPTGIYLGYTLIVSIIISIFLKMLNKSIDIKPVLILSLLVLPLNWILSHTNSRVVTNLVESTYLMGGASTVTPVQFIRNILGLPVYILLNVVIIKILLFKERVKLTLPGKVFVIFMLSLIFVLIVGMFKNSGDISFRLALDASIIITIITGILLGHSIQCRNRDIRLIQYLLVSGFAMPTVISWLR